MNKSEIAGRVADRIGVGRSAAGEAVDAVFEAIAETLARGEDVRIAGFGTFGTRSRPARTGRKPTGSVVATLTNPSSLTAGTLTFTAPADTSLTAGTGYHVVLDYQSSSGRSGTLAMASSNSQDAGRAHGWQMGNNSYVQPPSSWDASSSEIKIRVNGYAVADPSLPTVTAARVDGKTLTVTFDMALNATSKPAGSAFTVTATEAGSSRNPLEYRLTYAKPATHALQNRWGMEAAGFKDQAVTNAGCTASGGSGLSGSGTRMTATFHQPLEPKAAPARAHFTVTPSAPAAAPVPVVDAGFAANGAGVELTLGRALADGEAVTMHYRRPQGELGLWTATHSQLADFDVEGVAGSAAAATGVAVVSDPGDDATYAAGDKVRVQLTFGEAVDVDTSGGTPRLKIDLGGDDGAGERWAAYEDGSGTDALTFAWTAAAPDEAADGRRRSPGRPCCPGRRVTERARRTTTTPPREAMRPGGHRSRAGPATGAPRTRCGAGCALPAGMTASPGRGPAQAMRRASATTERTAR